MFEVMQYLFDRSFASAVVNSALAYNILKCAEALVSFVCGQPGITPQEWIGKRARKENSY
jgi:hypothetical protein